MKSLRQLLISSLILIISTNAFAQNLNKDTYESPNELLSKMDQDIEKLYTDSLKKINSAINSDNQVQLKEVILKVLVNEKDKEYINQLFLTFKPQEFKGIKIKYNENIFLVKAKNGKIFKISTVNDHLSKIIINNNEHDFSSFLSVKEVIEELARIASSTQSNTTVFKHFQSLLFGEVAHAAGVGEDIASGVGILLGLIMSGLSDDTKDFSQCRSRADRAESIMAIWSTECQISFNKKNSNSDRGRYMMDRKTDLSKNNLICNKEADRLKATMRTKKYLFLVKRNCFALEDGLERFCNHVKELQKCVIETNEYWRNPKAVLDNPRNMQKFINKETYIVPEAPTGRNVQK